MSVYQLLSCNVALGGDILNVVARHALIPVTYPELLVLRYIHGETSITEIHDVGAVERDDDEEMTRLQLTYGAELRDRLFPGAGARLPNGDNRFKPSVTQPVTQDQHLVDAPVQETTLAPGVTDYAPAKSAPTYVPLPVLAPLPDHAEGDPFGTAPAAPAAPAAEAEAEAEAPASADKTDSKKPAGKKG